MKWALLISAVTVLTVVFSSSGLLYIPQATDNQMHLDYVQQPGGNYSMELFLGKSYSSAGSSVALEFSGLGISVRNYGLLASLSFPRPMINEVSKRVQLLEKYAGISAISIQHPNIPLNEQALSWNGEPFTASQIAGYYGFNWAYSQGYEGQGITIVIVDAYGDPSLQYDLQAFDYYNSLPAPNLTVMYPQGLTTYNSSWAIETALDVEWAHAAAPKAKILLLVSNNAGSGLDESVSYAVTQRLGQIISLSWGTPESNLNPSDLQALNAVYSQAAKENITVVAASGDLGSNDGSNTQEVNYPASYPTVLSVGGVSLDYNNKNYTETAWGGVATDGSTYGSGGGYSSYFTAPYWQMSAAGSIRGVPDVAMIADPNTPVNMFVGGSKQFYGGTSLATPIWAGVIGIMDQYENRSLGNVAPILYQIYNNSAAYDSAFTQITSGSNGYYHASAGWNPVTGLGTPRVSALMNYTSSVLSGYSANVVFNGTGYNSTSISGNITVNYTTPLSGYQGGFYYYLQFLSQSGDAVRGGILIFNGSMYLRLELKQGNRQYAEMHMIGPLSPDTAFTRNLTLTVNQTEASVVSNSNSLTTDVFLTSFGSMSAGLGAGSYLSYDDLVSPYSGSFSGIRLSGGGVSTPSFAYEEHYSGLPGATYSDVNIRSPVSGTYGIVQSSTPLNGNINGSAPSEEILYNASLGSPYTATFMLSPYKSATWYVDGTTFTGKSYSFTGGGKYNVTATYNGGSVTRFILVPKITNQTIFITNPVSYYSASVNVTYGIFYGAIKTVTSNVTFLVPSYFGGLPVIVSSRGYSSQEAVINVGNTPNASFALVPEPVNLSVYSYPYNASISINSSFAPATYNDSYTFIHVKPDRYKLTASYPDYGSKSIDIALVPGTNASASFILRPNFTAYLVSGKVTDLLNYFPISGAEVNSTGAQTSFSNSTGMYYIYLTPGTHLVTFSKSGYNSTEVKISVNSQLSVNVSLKSLFVRYNYAIDFGFSYPFLFGFLYVSWLYAGNAPPLDYTMEISTSSSFASFTSVQLNGYATSVVATVSSPFSVHYVMLIAHLAGGGTFYSNPITIDPLSLANLLGNIGMIMLIGTFATYGFTLFRRIFRKEKT